MEYFILVVKRYLYIKDQVPLCTLFFKVHRKNNRLREHGNLPEQTASLLLEGGEERQHNLLEFNIGRLRDLSFIPEIKVENSYKMHGT